MAKYILKRDLPFAKAGAEASVNEQNGYIYINGMNINPHLYDKDTSFINKMINEGWIEEVEPEVFWVNKYRNGDIFVYSEESQAKQNLKDSHRTDKERTIKVIEVSE